MKFSLHIGQEFKHTLLLKLIKFSGASRGGEGTRSSWGTYLYCEEG